MKVRCVGRSGMMHKCKDFFQSLPDIGKRAVSGMNSLGAFWAFFQFRAENEKVMPAHL